MTNNSLLAAISGPHPCGESLRYDPLYDAIKEARRADDETLDQGVWKTEVKKADWRLVRSLCQKALKTKTKDLQIAIWLTEAWLHLDGLMGLAKGLQLITDLTHTYWKELHPENTELRLALYSWMNTHLVVKTGTSSAAAEVLGALAALTTELRRHVKNEAPAFTQLRRKIEEIQIKSAPKKAMKKVTPPKEAPPSPPPPAPAPKTGEKKPTIQNRDQAYRMLSELAAYLEAIEPHSPTPYLIKRAVEWGGMTLPQVLEQKGSLEFLADAMNVKKG